MYRHILSGFFWYLFVCECVVAQQSQSAASESKTHSDYSNNSWIASLRELRRDVHDCVKAKHSLWHCYKQCSLSLFDSVMQSDVIPIADGVRFVRIQNGLASAKSSDIKDSSVIDACKDFKYLTWFDALAMRLAKALTTHTLQINFGKVTEQYMRLMDKTESNKQQLTTDAVGTARLRRHRYNMIITMMFGVTALGAVLVPMGFQMLSIVSGKALLLAKMALLLASINGLKRVANNGLHYGLYHVPGENYGYYDRGDLSHGRHVPMQVPVPQPLDGLGLRK